MTRIYAGDRVSDLLSEASDTTSWSLIWPICRWCGWRS